MQQIADRYRLEESLSQGPSGEVFRAWDAQTERFVAVKRVPETADAARIQRDAALIKPLNSPHIVPILDVGVAADGRCFVATALVDGAPLADRFADGAQPVRQLLRWGAQIAEALAQAHAAGVMHGNLTPAHVVLVADPAASDPAGSAPIARVADFAVAIPGEAPSYRPPEAWRGTHGPAGDLYQLGVLLHEGLRGRPCFEGSPEALQRAHLQTAPPPLSGVDASVSETILRLLIKSPRGRPQRAAEVAATLRVLAQTTPETAQGGDPAADGRWAGAESSMPSIITKVWLLTGLSLLLVLAGILISSRLGTWDLPGSRVVDAPPQVFPQSTPSGWILPPAAAAASAASAAAEREKAKAKAPTPP